MTNDDDIPDISEEDISGWFSESVRPLPERIPDKLMGRPLGFVVERRGERHTLVAQATGLGTPERREDRPRVELHNELIRPKTLRGPGTVDGVHELISAVHAHSPWMADVSCHVMTQAERRVRDGMRFFGFDPVLMHGAPGVGKTHYARRLAEAAGVPVLILDGGSMTSIFQIAGLERGWGTSTPSPLIRLIADTGVANPIVVLDEADKPAGTGNGGNPHHALLGLLDRASARRWRDPFTELIVDLSRVSWVLTANELGGVPAPLKDRCRVLGVGAPGPRELAEFVRSRLTDQDPAIVEHAVRAARGMSLRRVSRMIEAVIAAGRGPVLN